MIAGKTRDNLQPWEPKQDKKCLNFQVFPWGKNNNDEKGKEKRKKNNLKLNRWYLDEGDVAQHVACLFLLEYGNGSKPICNQACTHNCQHYLRYQIDILWEEMTGVRENMGTARSGGGDLLQLCTWVRCWWRWKLEITKGHRPAIFTISYFSKLPNILSNH